MHSLRRIHVKTAFIKYIHTRVFEEIKIPVPWGHIAGKWWGPQDKKPILALHGWQDNCATFNTLIPYLPEDIPILAVDAPGHGLSSQLPPGVFYHGIDALTLLQVLKMHFGWSTLSLMGHSMGAVTNFTYTCVFPDNVELLICIDGLRQLLFTNKPRVERMASIINNFLKYQKYAHHEEEPPSYTMEEMKQRLHQGSRKSVSVEAAAHLLERNCLPSKKHPGKYYYSRDSRLKVGELCNWSAYDILTGCHRVTCPLLLIKAKESQMIDLKTNYRDVIDAIASANKDFHFFEVEGTHHVHLNDPEKVAGIVNDFLRKYADLGQGKGAVDGPSQR